MKKINTQRGASLLEVILAIALSVMLVPFMYNQIADMNNSFKDVTVANKIVKSRDKVINYIRLNQEDFQDEAGTQLTPDELKEIMPSAHTGWVFKTKSKDSEITEIFLAFRMDTDYQTANVARSIGNDAAIVSTDNVAYSQNWAIGIDDDFGFLPGDLIYRIVHDFGGEDKNKFLHRGTVGDERLNRMERELNLNWNNLHNVDEVQGLSESSLEVRNAQTAFMTVGSGGITTRMPFTASNIVFSKGAVLKSNDMCFEKLNVSDEVIGFSTISAKVLNAPRQTVNTGNVTIPIPATSAFATKGFSLGQANKDNLTGRTDSLSGTGSSGRIDPEEQTIGSDEREPTGLVKAEQDVLLKGAGAKLEFENVDNRGGAYAEHVDTDVFTIGKNGKIVISNEAGQNLGIQTESTKSVYSLAFSGANNWQYPRKDTDDLGSDTPKIETVYINNVNVHDALTYPIYRDYGKCNDIFEKYRK